MDLWLLLLENGCLWDWWLFLPFLSSCHFHFLWKGFGQGIKQSSERMRLLASLGQMLVVFGKQIQSSLMFAAAMERSPLIQTKDTK
jgi:hypothetical protein